MKRRGPWRADGGRREWNHRSGTSSHFTEDKTPRLPVRPPECCRCSPLHLFLLETPTFQRLKSVCQSQAHNQSSSMTDTEADGGVSGVPRPASARQKHNYRYRNLPPPPPLIWPHLSRMSRGSCRIPTPSQRHMGKCLLTPPHPTRPAPTPVRGKLGCKVVKQPAILHQILTFINHTCLWVNSQLRRFNKRCASEPGQSVRLHIYQCKRDHYGNSQREVNFNNCSK